MKTKLLSFIHNNDIILRIYMCFAIILALTAVLIGSIFLRLYEKNYLNSYTSILTQQSETIAKRITRFYQKDKLTQFQKYTNYIDELEVAEETDVWIVSSPRTDHPLPADFTNADTSSLTVEMNDVLNKAFTGSINSSSSYDKVYGMVILRVAAPVYPSKDSKEASGAIMMVSMLDKQSMGVQEGKYLISISILIGILVAFAVALAFSKYISHPLELIGREVIRLSEGDYSPLAVSKRNSQLGRLQTGLDDLSGRLRKIQEERSNLDRVRQDFFANISHELRTPITVIRGYAETLADGMISDADSRQGYYERLVSECQGMERLVGDLFILSKMQNPDFEIDKEPLSLIQVFSDITRNARILGQEKNIQIQTSFPKDNPCLMMGDYDRLRQMFMIIVDNAIKFSNPNGHIEITLMQRDEQHHICIRDHGIGISEKDLPYIFEKFYKSKLKQNEKGTGLGLMIAKQIALKHSGEIHAESQEGIGTAFYFTFQSCSIEDAEQADG